MSRAETPLQIEIVADLICPWCFIGKRRLQRALARRPATRAELSWRAFQLNPEMPREGISRGHYLTAKFGGPRNAERVHAGIAAAGKAEGIRFAWDRIERVPSTLDAHRLVRLATAEIPADIIVEALFVAYFTQGRDIGDREELAEIAAETGLSRSRARTALSGDAALDAVRDEDRRARRLGIHAVPCFIVDGGYAIAGAQEPEMFLPLLDLAAASASRSRG